MGVDRVKRHYDFNWADPGRHHCPDYMMRDGYWETFVANVGTVIAGSAPKPQPTYASVVSVPWQLGRDLGWQNLNGVQALSFVAQGTTRRRGIPRAWASDSAPPTGPAIPVGTAVTLTGYFRTADGVRWYLLGDGSRIRAISVDTDVRVIEKE